MKTVNSMPRYSVYKDSGVDWLKGIPEGWELVPLRGILNFRNEKNDPIITENILSLSIANGVTLYSDEGRGGNKRKDDLTAYKIARPNDIVMNSMNIIVGAVGLSKYFGAISPVYYALYAQNSSVFVPFYEQIFQHIGFQRSLLRLGKGILIKISDSGKMNTIRMKISQNDMKSLLFPKPSIETQILITNFLNQKTTQIDQAISIKQKQIELLKERQQIIIQNVITKGLDPKAPMKDSGVEWIGMIPEHWKIIPLKRLAVINPSIHIKNKNSIELTCFLPMEKVSVNGEISCDLMKPIREVSQGFTSFAKYDVIVAKITPCFENGKSAYLNNLATAFGYGSTEFHVLRASKLIRGKYLYNIIHSSTFLKMGEAMMTGSAGQKRVPTRFVADFLACLPSLEEQDKIVNYISQQIEASARVISTYQKQIEKLKEYKTTLIDSAVTGKIKITPEE